MIIWRWIDLINDEIDKGNKSNRKLKKLALSVILYLGIPFAIFNLIRNTESFISGYIFLGGYLIGVQFILKCYNDRNKTLKLLNKLLDENHLESIINNARQYQKFIKEQQHNGIKNLSEEDRIKILETQYGLATMLGWFNVR